jgi:hypothetical protein
VKIPSGTRPGRYQIWVGLFRGGERRPARSNGAQVVDDRALAGTIEVAR